MYPWLYLRVKGVLFHKNSDDLLKDEQSLKKLLEFDDGYRFLRPIHGTPAFWQVAHNELHVFDN